MKRARFDPGYERRKVQRRQVVLSSLQDKAADFCRSVADALTSPDVNLLTEPIIDPLCLDLILVAALGGLEGVECLKVSLGLVPKQFMAERSTFIQKIVNSNLTADKPLSANQLETLSCLLSASNYVKHQVPSQAYLSNLRQVSEDTGIAHTAFLAPPVSQCIIPQCQGSLSRHHPLVTVTVFTLANGPIPATKCCLKCSSCATIYNYAKYGKKTTEGECYYNEPRQYVEVSDVVYCERQLFQLYGLLSLHCWVSFSGFAEVYFEHTLGMESSVWAKTFKEQNKGALPLELTRKNISEMFFRGEVEEELRECPLQLEKVKFKADIDMEEFMISVEEGRITKLYPHQQSERCMKKGCGMAWAVDGNWKLTFPVCMFPVRVTQPGMHGLNSPNVCPDQPCGNAVFCKEHLVLAKQRGYPCTVKEFLHYCGAQKTAAMASSGDEQFDIEEGESETLDAYLDQIAVESSIPGVARSQGTEAFLIQHPSVLHDCEVSEDISTSCRKDLGNKGKLKHWSRGHIFIVRSCGHIDTWKPIYNSESCSQVFTIVLVWLMTVVENIPREEWTKIVIGYDNMCHLDALKVARNPLPLPPPYSEMWLTVTKVIDELHFKNHTDKICREKYDPSVIKEKHPGVSFMSAEQTFAWLTRFRKILSAMPKNHHLFYLHRLVKKRNIYTELCHRLNRKPLLPKTKDSKKL